MKDLILNKIEKIKSNKRYTYLGHWCNSDNSISSDLILNYIWEDRKLYLKDYKYLKNFIKKFYLY